ncbi:MAG: HD domain-containing protein [Calditrichaeota bacterium]|nr:MAG: HD domain-containing protein [Calditrichota bacterium]
MLPKTDIALNVHQLRQILQLSHALDEVGNPAQTVHRMARALEEIIPCMKCYVWLHDPDTQLLWTYADERLHSHKADEILAGRAFLEKQRLHLSHPPEEALIHPTFDRLHAAELGHFLAQPIHKADGTVIGIMQLMNSRVHPFSASVLDVLSEWALLAGARLHNILRLKQWQQAFATFSETISRILDTRDYITSGHSRRVTLYAMELSRQMNLSPAQKKVLRLAALLHDIGKLGIPELILLQKRRPNEDEYEIMRRHVNITRQVLQGVHFPEEIKEVVDIAAMHHEKFDGSGYPLGKKGDQIPLGARILAVCDTFDALSSRRPYAERQPFAHIVNLMDKETGAAFEPFIIYHFKNLPLGNLIRILEHGHEDHINIGDVRFLNQFTINDYMQAHREPDDNNRALTERFDYYYSRGYRV